MQETPAMLKGKKNKKNKHRSLTLRTEQHQNDILLHSLIFCVTSNVLILHMKIRVTLFRLQECDSFAIEYKKGNNIQEEKNIKDYAQLFVVDLFFSIILKDGRTYI